MIVYKATSRTSGKSYIGVTSKSVAVRWCNHVCRARKGWPGKLYCAIRKHGAGDFELSQVATAGTWDDLMTLERKFISELGTFDHGYNSTLGGEGNLGWVPSQEWRRKMSLINTGKSVSAETRLKISEATVGNRNPRYGVVPGNGTRKKISDWMIDNSPTRGVPKSAVTKSRMSASAKLIRRKNGTKYAHGGRSMILADWSQVSGISRHTLRQRIKNGWSFDAAISNPVDSSRSRNRIPA